MENIVFSKTSLNLYQYDIYYHILNNTYTGVQDYSANIYLLLLVTSGMFILFSGRAGKILDNTVKVLGGLASATYFAAIKNIQVVQEQVQMIKEMIKKTITVKRTIIKKMVMVIKILLTVCIELLIELQNILVKNINDCIVTGYTKVNSLSKSFAFPVILSMIDINVEHSSMTRLSFSIFVLSLISLLCFINVIVYMTGYVLIQKKDYENKYPKFSRLIRFYKNSSLVYVIIEGIICISCLLVLVVFSLLYLYKYSMI